ncbi:prolyl-tRNA synthetase [Pseudovirgaria hyperparasitica]|uniref:proline--tRNA ligase n=1 Tax=Pseudovirgaria hyperparasitica TaxID=470096 RepID=A0A6A6WHM6_9PEZI|nr:prolyl-tRNA synthetase [Pseudovirgaria hyperparasitica]KAF2761595.1 prolyl-tRNA synthetase [Pseudovirgaria hyperparasitica]
MTLLLRCLQSSRRHSNIITKVTGFSHRSYTTDGRTRLSNFFIPTGGIDDAIEKQGKGVALLVKAGFIRQARSGLFHFLPLGLRVLSKLEGLIDKHMTGLGASKLSLSSITTEKLWKTSGRYEDGSELFKIKDHRDSKFLLAPTHEEEITALVSDLCRSYKDFPLRLYQVSRKYRDEKRPRQGLLRAKEFIMKDLYTFDANEAAALATYNDVVEAYKSLFNELGLDYRAAFADSGNMGGKLSHEFHMLSPDGEDKLFICNNCEYTANEEVVEKVTRSSDHDTASPPSISHWTGISRDRKSLVYVFVPGPGQQEATKPSDQSPASYSHIDFRAVKSVFPELDTALDPSTNVERMWNSEASECSVVHIYDYRVAAMRAQALQPPIRVPTLSLESHDNKPLHLTRARDGDSCPKCSDGKLSTQQAIEVGHTFHLGTRYSEPFAARVLLPGERKPQALQMGCHGIGVSRLIGAIAAACHDERGLTWPEAIAPFHGVIIAKPEFMDAARKYYDDVMAKSGVDWVIDDRPHKSVAWKLRDADLIGFPTKVVLGDRFQHEGAIDVIHRK